MTPIPTQTLSLSDDRYYILISGLLHRDATLCSRDYPCSVMLPLKWGTHRELIEQAEALYIIHKLENKKLKCQPKQ